jgi:hypothetical protein
MIQKIKTLILSLSLMFSFVAPLATAASVSAQVNPNGTVQTNINNQLKCGSNIDLTTPETAKTCNTSDNGRSFTDILAKIINILSVLIGAIAVIMIIVGGFRYVTSAGSDSGVQAAKKTIMYALIGLVIVALAQVIVHFVLNNIT